MSRMRPTPWIVEHRDCGCHQAYARDADGKFILRGSLATIERVVAAVNAVARLEELIDDGAPDTTPLGVPLARKNLVLVSEVRRALAGEP